MTININELRRLAQAASHPTTKGRWIRLFGERTVYDRMEDGCRGIPVVSTDKHPPSPFEAACLDFIAAANPATISELLDRLEEVEKERDALRAAIEASANSRNEEESTACKSDDDLSDEALWAGIAAGMITPAHIARPTVAEQEEIEKERDELRSELKEVRYGAAVAHDTIKALRAKVEAMENQEPVAVVDYKRGSCVRFVEFLGWQKIANGAKLYALPGAQPAPSVPVAALRPVIDWLRNGCDPQEAAKELELLIGVAPEAKP